MNNLFDAIDEECFRICVFCNSLDIYSRGTLLSPVIFLDNSNASQHFFVQILQVVLL